MSRAMRSRQPPKLSTKENITDSLDTKRFTIIRPTGSKIQTTKGNDKLFNANVISALRLPVLQDRTNLTLESTKVLLKKGKDEKAGSGATKSNETKRTRSSKLKEGEEAKISGTETGKKKDSSLAKVVEASREEEDEEKGKMEGPISSGSNENIRSTRRMEKGNKIPNDIKSVKKNKKDIVKIIVEQKVASKVNTRSTKTILSNKPESSSKKTITRSKLVTQASKDPKQTKISTMRLRKGTVHSEDSEKSSNDVEEQKKSTVRSVTRSKTKDVEDDSDFPTSTATKESEKSEKRLITRSKTTMDAADGIDDEPKSSQDSKKSSKSKIPTRESSKNLPMKNTQQRLSTRIKNVTGNNKFFKNKRLKPPTVAHSKISPLKRAVIGLGRNNTKIKKARIIPVPRESSSFHLRQTTLKESFSNCAKKSLRPRNTDKNYCEESKIIDKHISPNKKNSAVELEKINVKTGPIYRRNLEENQEKDKEKVYDFVVDKNDSTRKKRKKRVVRKAPTKKAKTATTTKNNTDAVLVKPTKNAKAAEQVKIASDNDKLVDNDEKITFQEPVVPKTSTKPPSNKNTAMNNHRTIEVIAEIYSPPSPNIGHEATDIQLQETIKLPKRLGPIIVSDQELQGECRINITGTPLQPKSKEEAFSRPFRATNAFNMKPSMQVKTMMEHSLIRRSLSPISKASTPAYIEDTGSPWRPIIPSTFSRVKNVFQSTPQGEKFTTKTALGSNKQLYNTKINKIVEQNNEHGNMSKNNQFPIKKSNKILKSPTKSSNNISKSPIKSSNNTSKSPMKSSNNTSKSPMKKSNSNSKSPRKFATEISNINLVDENQCQKSPSKSPRTFGSEISNINQLNVPKPSPMKNKPKQQVEVENSRLVIEIVKRRSPVQENVPDFDEIIEDKENSAPNDQNPTKTLTETPQIQTPSSPQQGIEVPENSTLNIEEFDPQPGPSGLQKLSSPVNTWNLKQTNLNKFLNLPDMPERTRISTVQGIFDDAHSTPITRKGMKRLATQLDVVDAFGFDESDNGFEEIDNISPIKRGSIVPSPVVPVKKLLNDARKNYPQVNKNPETYPMRISVGEIKKTLQSNAIKNNEERVEAEEMAPTVHQMPHVSSKKDVVQAISFSDTFDIVNEENNTQDIEGSIKEVPLFVDLEPVHFNKPPRYSYKRKRHQQFHAESEDEDENEEREEEERHRKRPQKKKKMGKAEREQKKKLDEWAKSVNETFEEIDHFSLIIE